MDFLTTTTRHRLECALAVMALSLASDALAQEAPGEIFNSLVDAGCAANTLPGALCSEFNADGGSGAPGGGVGGNNNFGTVGGQNQASAAAMSEPLGFLSELGLGVFGTVYFGNRERPETTLENGYDGDVTGGLLGIERAFGEKLGAGLTVQFSTFDADFDGGAGDLETDTVNTTLFVNYGHADNTTLDAYLGYATTDQTLNRNITVQTGTKQARGDTDGTTFSAGIGVSLDWPRGPWLLSLNLNSDYQETRIDNYTEVSTTGTTNYLLSFPDQEIDSLTTSLGLGAAYTASTSWGVFIPQGHLRFVRESENEAREVSNVLLSAPQLSIGVATDPGDATYLIGDLGATAVLPGDWQLFGEVSVMAANDLLDSYSISLGFHKQF